MEVLGDQESLADRKGSAQRALLKDDLLPLKRTEVRQAFEITSVRRDYPDAFASGARRNQGVIGQSSPSDVLISVLHGDFSWRTASHRPVVQVGHENPADPIKFHF